MRDYPLDEIILPMGATDIKDRQRMDGIWDSEDYVCEEKYDGSRYLSIGGRFFSRRISVKDNLPVEKTANIPHIAKLLNLFPNLILDGEVYYEGKTSNEVTSIMGADSHKARWRQGFGVFLKELGGYANSWFDSDGSEHKVTKAESIELMGMNLRPLRYVAFDILRDIHGNWLIDKPWHERRVELKSAYLHICAVLHAMGDSTHREYFELSRIEQDDKRAFHAEIVARGGEGVILKDIHGVYVAGKKPVGNWVKVKPEMDDDCIILGFSDAERDYKPARPELIYSHPYWEARNGDLYELSGKNAADDVARNMEIPLEPVTKFYFNGWIGAVEFGKWDTVYIDANGLESNYADVKEAYRIALIEGHDISFDDFLQLYREEYKVVNVGRCSGINEKLRIDMTDNPEKYIGECVEVKAMEFTEDMKYRHPQWGRLRPDKNPEECVVEWDKE